MIEKDFARFCVSWNAAQAAYNAKAEPQTLALIFKVLARFDLADVETGIARHLSDTETGQFPPKPADVVRHIEGTADAVAALAWADFREATGSGDMPKNNPALSRVIQRMGGLDRLGDRTPRDVDFMFEQFKALYLAETRGIGLPAIGSSTMSKAIGVRA